MQWWIHNVGHVMMEKNYRRSDKFSFYELACLSKIHYIHYEREVIDHGWGIKLRNKVRKTQ
jgi:hypothetical protein